MPRTRSPKRDKAYEIYAASGGMKKLIDIAEEIGVSAMQVRKWKNQDNWNEKMNGNVTNAKSNVTIKIKEPKKKAHNILQKVVASVEANEELTEKQRLFCVYYIQSFSAAQAYLKAYECSYGTACTEGPVNLRKPQIKAEIQRLKAIRNEGIMICEEDIVERMMRIAFADITDIAEFDGCDVMVKSSGAVDGAVINSVEATKFGIKVKLADRQRALEWLADYFGMRPSDKHKAAYDNARLEIERDKVQIMRDKLTGEDGSQEAEEDTFVAALEGKVSGAWQDEG